MALKQRNRCLAGGSKQMFWACLSFLVQVWWSCFQRHNCYLNRWYLILTCFNIYFCFFNSFFHFANCTGSMQLMRLAKAPGWTERQSNATEKYGSSHSDLHPTNPSPWNVVPFSRQLLQKHCRDHWTLNQGLGSLPEGYLNRGCTEIGWTFTETMKTWE